MQKQITSEDLLDELHRLSGKLQKTPTASEMREHGRFSIGAYQSHFGSWNNAIEEAGLEVNLEQTYKVTKRELMFELYRLANELGKVPTAFEMSEHGAYSFEPYQRHFGSWSNAVDRMESA